MAEEELTAEEQRKIVLRCRALSLSIENQAGELNSLLDALMTKKSRSKKEVDEFGEPTYAFKVKCGIPEDIKLTRKMRDYALQKGFNASTLQPVWEGFTNYYRRKGTKWQDWSAVWQKWVRGELERRASGNKGSIREMPEL